MVVQSITAIFQKGVLKPLVPLNLAENERVEVQIIQPEKSVRPTLALSGIWKGLGDPTYEEIAAITRGARQARLQELSSLLDRTDPN